MTDSVSQEYLQGRKAGKSQALVQDGVFYKVEQRSHNDRLVDTELLFLLFLTSFLFFLSQNTTAPEELSASHASSASRERKN